MVASQLPEVPVNSENRGASDLPYGRGMATSHKVVPLKSGAPLVPSSAWEVVTGPSSSCPRALGACEPGPPEKCKLFLKRLCGVVVLVLVWRSVGVEPAFRGLLVQLEIV